MIPTAPDLASGYIINASDQANSWRTGVECVLRRKRTDGTWQTAYLSHECRAEHVGDHIFGEHKLYEFVIVTGWDGVFALRHGSYNHGFNLFRRDLPESCHERVSLATRVNCAERPIRELPFDEALAFCAEGQGNALYLRIAFSVDGRDFELFAPHRYTNFANAAKTTKRYLQPISGLVLFETGQTFRLAYVAAHVTPEGTTGLEFLCRRPISFIATKPTTGRAAWLFGLFDRLFMSRLFVTDEFHDLRRVEGNCSFYRYQEN